MSSRRLQLDVRRMDPAACQPSRSHSPTSLPYLSFGCSCRTQRQEGAWWAGLLAAVLGIVATGITADTPVGTPLVAWLLGLSLASLLLSFITLMTLDGARWIQTKVIIVLWCQLWGGWEDTLSFESRHSITNETPFRNYVTRGVA